jgi:hypothetical protein
VIVTVVVVVEETSEEVIFQLWQKVLKETSIVKIFAVNSPLTFVAGSLGYFREKLKAS